jgi:4-methyl-5(b-hydroxyethyl)-thiazole monophosphate biosynthesis
MPGSERLRDSASLKTIIDAQNSKNKLVGAICAAPAVVLASYGVLKGKTATCYPVPKFQDQLEKGSNDAVVVDGHIVTSKGPGTALSFSLKLVELLRGKDIAQKISSEMLA